MTPGSLDYTMGHIWLDCPSLYMSLVQILLFYVYNMLHLGQSNDLLLNSVSLRFQPRLWGGHHKSRTWISWSIMQNKSCIWRERSLSLIVLAILASPWWGKHLRWQHSKGAGCEAIVHACVHVVEEHLAHHLGNQRKVGLDTCTAGSTRNYCFGVFNTQVSKLLSF